MRLTLFGYIPALFEIADFMPAVYTNGDSFFLAQYEANCITGFHPVDTREITIVETDKEIEKQEGDTPYYFYATDHDQLIEGDYGKVFGSFLELVRSPDLNEFARLSIANFLRLEGLKFQMINSINKLSATSGQAYHLSFDDGSYADPGRDVLGQTLKKVFAGYSILIETSKGEVRYTDIVCFHSNSLYFSGFKCTIRDFLETDDSYFDILRKIFHEIDEQVIKKILLDNDYLYLMNLENTNDDLVPTRQNFVEEISIVQSQYHFEHLLSRFVHPGETKLSPSDEKLIEGLKEMKYALIQ